MLLNSCKPGRCFPPRERTGSGRDTERLWIAQGGVFLLTSVLVTQASALPLFTSHGCAVCTNSPVLASGAVNRYILGPRLLCARKGPPSRYLILSAHLTDEETEA